MSGMNVNCEDKGTKWL